jgi:hypothetical protein
MPTPRADYRPKTPQPLRLPGARQRRPRFMATEFPTIPYRLVKPLLDAFSAVYELRTQRSSGWDSYYLSNLPSEFRPARSKGSDDDQVSSDVARRTVATAFETSHGLVVGFHEEFGRFLQALNSPNCFVDTVVHQIQCFIQMCFLHDQMSFQRQSGRKFGS